MVAISAASGGATLGFGRIRGWLPVRGWLRGRAREARLQRTDRGLRHPTAGHSGPSLQKERFVSMGLTDYPQRGYLQPHESSTEPAETCARLIWRPRQRRSSGHALPLAVRLDPTAEVANVKGSEALRPVVDEDRRAGAGGALPRSQAEPTSRDLWRLLPTGKVKRANQPRMGDESTRRLDRCSEQAWRGSMRRSLTRQTRSS